MAITTAPETIQVGQLALRFHATAEQTRGALSVFEVIVPRGSRVPPAHHHAVEEVVYGLSGILTFYVDEVPHEIRPGESLIVPGGTAHRFENHHEEDARVLTVQTPGTIGPAFYRETAGVLGAGGPPDPAQMKAVMNRHGLTPVPPRA